MDYQAASEVFQSMVVDLGPVPLEGDEGYEPFADFCLLVGVGDLEPGHLIILTYGSWTNEFAVEAVYITTTVLGDRGTLFERVWRSPNVIAHEREFAVEVAAREAGEAGNLDEEGNPIVPLNIQPGDNFIPRRIKLRTGVEVYVLNYAGLSEVRAWPGYVNPTALIPIHKNWSAKPLIRDNYIPGVNIQSGSSVSPLISYKNQQDALGVSCFKLLIGRDMNVFRKIVDTSTKIDENCALKLADQFLVTDYMKSKKYVSDPKQLVLLMTGLYRGSKENGFFCLQDFASGGRVWTDTAPMWEDLMIAAIDFDSLFRPNVEPFLHTLFTMAMNSLNRVTHYLIHSAKFTFVFKQMNSVWQSFGAALRSASALLDTPENFERSCINMFEFEGKDLEKRLRDARDYRLDEILVHSELGGKRNLGSPDGGGKKKPPVAPGNAKVYGFCYNFYAYKADATHPKGDKYLDCSNWPKCKKFSHVAVSSVNKEVIKGSILGSYADTRVKIKVEEYLNKF